MAIQRFGTVRFDKLGLPDTNFSDTVQKLKKVESRYGNQLIRWKKDWGERLKAFRELRKQTNEFRSSLTALSSIDSFLIKKSVSSKEGVATAVSKSQSQEGVYNLNVAQLATNTSWSIDTGLASKNSVLNNSAGQLNFVYNFKGEDRTIKIPPGTTLEGLKNIINNNALHKGVKASIIQSNLGAMFQLQTIETGADTTLFVKSSEIPSMPVSLNLDGKWEISSNSALLHNDFPDTSSAMFPGLVGTQTFVFKFDGNKYSIPIDAATSLDSLAASINAAVPQKFSPIAQSVANGSNGFNLQLFKADTVYPVTDESNDLINLNTLTFDSPDSNIDGPKTYSFIVDGKTYTAKFTGSHTPQQIVNSFNFQKTDSAAIKYDPVTTQCSVSIKSEFIQKHTIQVSSEGTCDALDYVPPVSPGWLIKAGQNAKIRINDWPSDPNWLETSSNQISDVVEGMTFNLHGLGITQVSVQADSDALIKNITNFLEATNKLRQHLLEITTVDTEKITIDLEDAESMFEMQKGSILTGNYGVQLIDSRMKLILSSTAKGFMHASIDNGVMKGDRFAALSQIGIMNNAEKGSPAFGQLEAKMVSDGKTSKPLTEAIKEDPMAVAELFAANGQGKSYSPGISYNSHVHKITQPGIYDVNYTVENDYSITNIFINGKPGKYDPITKQINLIPQEPRDAAEGLVIDIFDFTPGEHSGQVGVKEGVINELISLLDGPEGILNKDSGTLGILEKNYENIISNIDKKITRENERVKNWEVRTTLRFARLESNLASYNKLNEQMKQLIGQLSQK